MFIAVAVHHAAPEHRDEFIDFMHKVIEATDGAPGPIAFKACRDPADRFLAGLLPLSQEAFGGGPGEDHEPRPPAEAGVEHRAGRDDHAGRDLRAEVMFASGLEMLNVWLASPHC